MDDGVEIYTNCCCSYSIFIIDLKTSRISRYKINSTVSTEFQHKKKQTAREERRNSERETAMRG